tara:strand:- start:1106 stop:1381 length:276 start_codon:yes stop_codon:yes gene_type:complete
MRKSKKMVSLNPKYATEVTSLDALAEKVKDDNPELYNILTIIIASLIGKDEKKLLEYCNKYLEEKLFSDKLKKSINDMLKNSDDNSDLFNY